MLTYLIIGLVVQLVILVERFIRLPGLWTYMMSIDWNGWIAVFIGIIINVLTWPLSIIMEIWLIINGL